MMWAEIRNDFEDEGVIYIDAWKTNVGSEEGTVIAKVYLEAGQPEVQYLNELARTDAYAQEVINESVEGIKKRKVQSDD